MTFRKMIRTVCLFVLVSCVFAAWASAQEDNVPTDITADKMTYSQQQNTVVFTGNVVVTRPDFTLTAKKLTVELQETGSEKSMAERGDRERIKRILASGSVHVMQEGKEGFCEDAVYDAATNTIVMRGDPRLVDGKNTIEGAVIRFDLTQNTSIVEGSGSERVKAKFFSRETDMTP